MASMSPLQILLLIIAGLSLAGVIIAFIRSQRTFSGYGEIADEVRRLAGALAAEAFRDGSDVVVSGTYLRTPVVVRFSNAESTPGLNVRMQAPATFTLSVAPAGQRLTEGGRVQVATTDGWFDKRFSTRTDHPLQAKMLIARPTTALLRRLACSSHTYVSIGKGAVELSELAIPQPQTAKHVLDHLETMAKLSAVLRLMPGADRVKAPAFKRERHIAARAAMAVGVVVAVLSVVAAMQAPKRTATPSVAEQAVSSGILPRDAALIPNAREWRTVSADELDPVAVRWMRNNGGQPEGRIEADLSGKGTGRDVAYLLAGKDGSRRVVLLADNETRYDTGFPFIGLAARVPKANVGSIAWVGGSAPVAEGDGILLVRKKDDVSSGIVLFLSGRGIVSATPVNYQDIRLE